MTHLNNNLLCINYKFFLVLNKTNNFQSIINTYLPKLHKNHRIINILVIQFHYLGILLMIHKKCNFLSLLINMFHTKKWHHFYQNWKNIYPNINNTCLVGNLHIHPKNIVGFVWFCHCKNSLLLVMSICLCMVLCIHRIFQSIFNTHFSLNNNPVHIPCILDLWHLIYRRDNYQGIFDNLPLLQMKCINILLVSICWILCWLIK